MFTPEVQPSVESVRPRGDGRRAFTLVELLTVIAIIAVLGGIVIGVGRHSSEIGKIARAKTELAVLSGAIEKYKQRHGDYPQTGDAAILLQSLIGKLNPVQLQISGQLLLDLAVLRTRDALDPLVKSTAVLIDPWDQPYVYRYKTSSWKNPSFVLYSIGPDGVDDGLLIIGGFPNHSGSGNVDNIYANQ